MRLCQYDDVEQGCLVILSGMPASGKSTIASALARRFRRGVHVEGDVIQRMIVSGAVWPQDANRAEARRQLGLRGRLALRLAESFAEAGFVAVLDEILIGRRLEEILGQSTFRPLRLVTLVPRLEVVRQRDGDRSKGRGDEISTRWAGLDERLRHSTTRAGLWLDTSDLAVDETVEEILNSWDLAMVTDDMVLRAPR